MMNITDKTYHFKWKYLQNQSLTKVFPRCTCHRVLYVMRYRGQTQAHQELCNVSPSAENAK